MAKKSELLEEAKKLKLKVTEKNTIAEIQNAIDETKNLDSSVSKKSSELDNNKPKLAKAGKHSEKGILETKQKQAKIERQLHKDDKLEDQDQSKKPKKVVKPTRSKLERRGKKYQELHKLIEKSKEYSISEAIDLATKTNPSKFDASVELHIRLGVDPRQADQNIRGTLNLPAGTGKSIRVAVFADEDDVKKAKSVGADIAGTDDFLQMLDKEQLDFDILISTPQMMAKLSKYARLLGPKGLMPNPKSGTVTKDVGSAVKEAKAGKVEFRVDASGIVHLAFGKTSFKTSDLVANAKAVTNAIKSAKPATLKGGYVISVYITTSMGPSIKVNTNDI